MEIYVVQLGDTVDALANFYKVPPNTVIYDNQLVFPYNLAVGQAILMRDGKVRDRKHIFCGGYAYPFISEWTLEQSLPFLSELYVFSYGFQSDGTLIPPQIEDTDMVIKANRHGVKATLTLVPFGPSGHFNNQLVSDIANDLEAREKLVQNVLETLRMKGYGGVNVDFEYVKAEDRDGFSDFVKYLTDTINPYGYHVSVALAPKTSDDQPGILYEGMDYEALGKAANYVFLMTYEWGYTYGPPMAVAPIDKVRQVVEYAVSKIPRAKILMGIPNYGYDWPLPFVAGTTKARTLGNVEAVQQAIDLHAKIEYDVIAATPYYHYLKDGVEHVVWFEDVRSLRAKFNLVDEFGLKGFGYWQLMQYFRANWLLLNDKYDVIQK